VRFALLRVVPLVLAAVFIAACTGYGLLARAPDMVTSAALGIGMFGAISFVAALAHLARPMTYTLLIIGGLVVVASSRKTIELLRSSSAVHRSSLGMAIIAVVIVLILPFVVAPDVSTDALEYHLLVPKLYVVQNGISYLPHFVESNYPSLAEYDFMALLSVSDDRTAKAFHFLCGILVLLAIGRLAPSSSTIAAALFFSMPLAAITSGWAWNDMLFTLFVVLSVACIVEERFLLAGVFFGFATWTKYTFVLAAFGIAAMLIGRSRREIVRFAIPVLGIAAIWMTKNAILTGNPVYPFLNPVFHSPFWSEAANRYFRGTLTRYEIPEWHWWTWLAFPALLTVKPRVIDVHPGVLPLILLPLAFIRPFNRLHRYVAGVVVGWLLIRTEARSLLTVFAVLSAIYAARIEVMRGWRWIVAAGVACNLAIMMISTSVVTSPARYFVGLETRKQYVQREDTKQGAYDWLNTQPSVHGVLLVGLHDPYYLNKPALFSSCCDTPVAQSVDVNALKSNGVTHIAFRPREFVREHNDGLYSWSAQQREAFVAFLRQRCRPVVRIADVTIFELLP
jgi:hypothetical protein